jgi:hypothetical protein
MFKFCETCCLDYVGHNQQYFCDHEVTKQTLTNKNIRVSIWKKGILNYTKTESYESVHNLNATVMRNITFVLWYVIQYEVFDSGTSQMNRLTEQCTQPTMGITE